MRSHYRIRVWTSAGPNLLIGALLAVWVALEAGPQAAETQAEAYLAASIDDDGRLVVTTSDRREIVVSKAVGQRAWGAPILSADGRAVAA